MSNAPDFHRGAQVVLPTGETVLITARQSGPVMLWKAGGRFWREDQLRLPDEPTPEGISDDCRRKSGHQRCGGAFMVGRVSHICACRCGHVDGPGRRPRVNGKPGGRVGHCVDCGAETSRPSVIRCITCAGTLRRKSGAAGASLMLADPKAGA